jgi:hypothetical protein
MSTARHGTTSGFTDIPRAVLSLAVGVVDTVERAVVGDARVRTARGNAWEAICADRDRALQRDEIRRLVATLGQAAVRTRDGRPLTPAASRDASVSPAGGREA